jgi:putative transposase
MLNTMANTYTQCYFHLVFAGAFTHSHSQIDPVAKYILSQEEHHKRKSFKEEYFEIPEKNNVEFKKEYLFEFFSDIIDCD